MDRVEDFAIDATDDDALIIEFTTSSGPHVLGLPRLTPNLAEALYHDLERVLGGEPPVKGRPRPAPEQATTTRPDQ